MIVRRYQNAAEFYELVEPLLLEREAENNLLLGIVGGLRSQPRNPTHFFGAVFENADDARPIMASHATGPQFPLLITRAPWDALDTFTNYVRDHRIPCGGVAGPDESARRVAIMLRRMRGLRSITRVGLRLFQAQKVIPPKPASGAPRFAEESDKDLVLRWSAAFAKEMDEPHLRDQQHVLRRLEQRQYYLWCDPDPVSMAALAAPTLTGVRINSVYTPPDARGRGYASNVVASLTQHLLASGKRFCFLYTEEDNATTNRIYPAIGYDYVCDWANFRF